MHRALLLFMLSLVGSSVDAATMTSNSPCNLGAFESNCSVNISYTMTEAPISCLWLSNNQLFACAGQTATHVWPFTPLAGTTLILRGHQSWDNLQPTAPELKRITVYGVVPPLAIPATNGQISSYYTYPTVAGAGARVKFRFGDAASGVLYPADAHYFVRKLPSPANTFHTYWPTVQTNPSLDPVATIGEETAIKSGCQNGTSWLWLNRYINYHPSYTNVGDIQTIKAIYSHGGKSWDITNVCGTQAGQPFAPLNVPSGAYRMQVWGYIYPSSARVPFYWDWEGLHVAGVTNPHWVGGGSTTRSAHKSSEAWWDRGGPWPGEMAALTQPAHPNNYTGLWPTGRGAGGVGTVARNRDTYSGFDAGVFWKFDDPPTIARNINRESYPGPWPLIP